MINESLGRARAVLERARQRRVSHFEEGLATLRGESPPSAPSTASGGRRASSRSHSFSSSSTERAPPASVSSPPQRHGRRPVEAEASGAVSAGAHSGSLVVRADGTMMTAVTDASRPSCCGGGGDISNSSVVRHYPSDSPEPHRALPLAEDGGGVSGNRNRSHYHYSLIRSGDINDSARSNYSGASATAAAGAAAGAAGDDDDDSEYFSDALVARAAHSMPRAPLFSLRYKPDRYQRAARSAMEAALGRHRHLRALRQRDVEGDWRAQGPATDDDADTLEAVPQCFDDPTLPPPPLIAGLAEACQQQRLQQHRHQRRAPRPPRELSLLGAVNSGSLAARGAGAGGGRVPLSSSLSLPSSRLLSPAPDDRAADVAAANSALCKRLSAGPSSSGSGGNDAGEERTLSSLLCDASDLTRYVSRLAGAAAGPLTRELLAMASVAAHEEAAAVAVAAAEARRRRQRRKQQVRQQQQQQQNGSVFGDASVVRPPPPPLLPVAPLTVERVLDDVTLSALLNAPRVAAATIVPLLCAELAAAAAAPALPSAARATYSPPALASLDSSRTADVLCAVAGLGVAAEAATPVVFDLLSRLLDAGGSGARGGDEDESASRLAALAAFTARAVGGQYALDVFVRWLAECPRGSGRHDGAAVRRARLAAYALSLAPFDVRGHTTVVVTALAPLPEPHKDAREPKQIQGPPAAVVGTSRELTTVRATPESSLVRTVTAPAGGAGVSTARGARASPPPPPPPRPSLFFSAGRSPLPYAEVRGDAEEAEAQPYLVEGPPPLQPPPPYCPTHIFVRPAAACALLLEYIRETESDRSGGAFAGTRSRDTAAADTEPPLVGVYPAMPRVLCEAADTRLLLSCRGRGDDADEYEPSGDTAAPSQLVAAAREVRRRELPLVVRHLAGGPPPVLAYSYSSTWRDRRAALFAVCEALTRGTHRSRPPGVREQCLRTLALLPGFVTARAAPVLLEELQQAVVAADSLEAGVTPEVCGWACIAFGATALHFHQASAQESASAEDTSEEDEEGGRSQCHKAEARTLERAVHTLLACLGGAHPTVTHGACVGVGAVGPALPLPLARAAAARLEALLLPPSAAPAGACGAFPSPSVAAWALRRLGRAGALPLLRVVAAAAAAAPRDVAAQLCCAESLCRVPAWSVAEAEAALQVLGCVAAGATAASEEVAAAAVSAGAAVIGHISPPPEEGAEGAACAWLASLAAAALQLPSLGVEARVYACLCAHGGAAGLRQTLHAAEAAREARTRAAAVMGLTDGGSGAGGDSALAHLETLLLRALRDASSDVRRVAEARAAAVDAAAAAQRVRREWPPERRRAAVTALEDALLAPACRDRDVRAGLRALHGALVAEL